MHLGKFFICLAVILCSLTSITKAQDWGYEYREIQVAAGYEMPLNIKAKYNALLPAVYKPAISINAGYTTYTELDWGIEFLAGYMKFQPKADTLYFVLAPDNYGTAVYSDLHIGYLSVGVKKIHPLNFETFVPFYGLEFGYYYNFYEEEIQTQHYSRSGQTIEGMGNFALKIGMDYYFSESVGLFYQLKYNGMFVMGSADSGAANFNSSLGAIDFFLTNNLGLKFRF